MTAIVKFTEEVWNQQEFFVQKATGEISWLGRVVDQGENDAGIRTFLVDKIYLLDQECTGASTEIDGSSIAKLMQELGDDFDNVLFWGHSHVNMGVFWSATDDAQVENFVKNQRFVISYVFNKKREYSSRIDMRVDGFRVRFDKLSTFILKGTMQDEAQRHISKIMDSLDFDVEESQVRAIINTFLRRLPKENLIVDRKLTNSEEKELAALMDEKVKIPAPKYVATNSKKGTKNGGELSETSWIAASWSSRGDEHLDDWSWRDRIINGGDFGEDGFPKTGDLGRGHSRGSQFPKPVLPNKRHGKGKG